MTAVDRTRAEPSVELVRLLHERARLRARRSALAEALGALDELVLGARDSLSDREIAAFVSIGCGVFAHESARLHLGQFLRDVQGGHV